MTTVLRSHSELDTLPSGKYRLTQHLKPIAYDHGGAWTRITNVLGNSGDPNFPIGTDELLQFRIRNRLAGQSPMLHFGKGNHSLRATLLDTNNTDGIVNGAAILFPNAWNNADFELILAGHKIKGNVYLRSGHPQTYRLRIDESTGFDPATLMLGDVARILPPVLLPPASSPAAQIPLSWAITQQGGKWILAVTLPQGNYAGWVLDPTLTLQPDAADGLDALMVSNVGDTNFGTNAALQVGDNSVGENQGTTDAIEFDVSSIPSNGTVTAATLSLYEEDAVDTAGVGSWAVNVHRSLRAWVESQVTWNSYSTGNSWTTGGGRSNGNDRAAAVSATVTLDGTAANDFIDWSGTTLTANVQGFVDGSLTNNGWLFEAPNADFKGVPKSGNQFRSSDHTTAANRPKLVVEYTLPTANSRIMLLRFR